MRIERKYIIWAVWIVTIVMLIVGITLLATAQKRTFYDGYVYYYSEKSNAIIDKDTLKQVKGVGINETLVNTYGGFFLVYLNSTRRNWGLGLTIFSGLLALIMINNALSVLKHKSDS